MFWISLLPALVYLCIGTARLYLTTQGNLISHTMVVNVVSKVSQPMVCFLVIVFSHYCSSDLYILPYILLKHIGRQTHRHTDTHTYTQTQTHRHTDTQTHTHTHTYTVRHIDKQTSRHTETHRDTQGHRHTETHTQSHLTCDWKPNN